MIFPNSRNFNFDTALRYEPVVQEIEKLNFKKSPVLELGSGTNGISDFYSGKVVGIDADFAKTETKKNSNIEHRKGSILELPLENSSFSVVVCLDTLEHLSEIDQAKAVSEMWRVTKKGGTIFLGFPTGFISTKAEGLINFFYNRVYKKNHIWLSEHQQNGLPDLDKIVSLFKDQGVKDSQIRIKGNVNILVWIKIHLLFTVFYSSILSHILKRLYKLVFWLAKFNCPPYYRRIIIIKK